MLVVLAVKFILKGAVKSLVLQPAISATLSMVPSTNLLNVTLLGNNLGFTTSDLLKFGVEKLYERYGESKLDFHITKLSRQYYQIVPANELAEHFFKDYVDEEELIVDLDRVDKYLDVLYDEDMDSILSAEAELDEAQRQIFHDLDIIIDRAPKSAFDGPNREQELIDEIINKNKALIDKSIQNKIQRSKEPQSAIDEILLDFPSAPTKPTTDEEAIQEILDKFSPDKIKGRKRKGVKS